MAWHHLTLTTSFYEFCSQDCFLTEFFRIWDRGKNVICLGGCGCSSGASHRWSEVCCCWRIGWKTDVVVSDTSSWEAPNTGFLDKSKSWLWQKELHSLQKGSTNYIFCVAGKDWRLFDLLTAVMRLFLRGLGHMCSWLGNTWNIH